MKLQLLGRAGPRTHRQQRRPAEGRCQLCLQKGVPKAREAGAFVYDERRRRSAEAFQLPALSRTLRTSKRYELVYDSTCGDRLHKESDPESELADIVTKTAGRGGIVLIPSFAVGCAQMLLYLIHKIMAEGRIPKMLAYLNSPMAIKATEIFSRHHKEHKLSAAQCGMIDENTDFFGQ